MGKRSQAKTQWLTMSQRVGRGEATSGARWLRLMLSKTQKAAILKHQKERERVAQASDEVPGQN